MKTVRIMRHGQAVEVSQGVYLYNSRKRKAAIFAGQKQRLVTRILDYFQGDTAKATEFISTTFVPQGRLVLAELIRRGKFRVIDRFLMTRFKSPYKPL